MVADFSKKGNKDFLSKELLFQALGILFLVVVGFLIFKDFQIYQKKKELTAQIINYQKQIADIQKSSQNLKEEIANSDNPDYLEKIAYEQLGQQKPGEKEYIFTTPSVKPKPAAAPQNFLDTKVWTGWVSRAWSWIKSKF